MEPSTAGGNVSNKSQPTQAQLDSSPQQHHGKSWFSKLTGAWAHVCVCACVCVCVCVSVCA
jgi:negative regulator of sigma E activity